jgi:hypothetical protein
MRRSWWRRPSRLWSVKTSSGEANWPSPRQQRWRDGDGEKRGVGWMTVIKQHPLSSLSITDGPSISVQKKDF